MKSALLMVVALAFTAQVEAKSHAKKKSAPRKPSSQAQPVDCKMIEGILENKPPSFEMGSCEKRMPPNCSFKVEMNGAKWAFGYTGYQGGLSHCHGLRIDAPAEKN